MKFPIKKSRSFFREIGSCASYASCASCASYACRASENRRMFGIKAMGMNSFHRLRLLLPPPTGRSPSLEEGGLGFRRSRPSALPSIGYRGFAIAPMTLRAPSRRFLYNSGCRVETLLVSMGVMGFLGDLRGRNSKSPPNPLGLAERVHRPQTMIPPRSPTPHSSCEFGFFFIFFLCLVCLLCRGLRRSRPAALPSIAYKGFAVAPKPLRAPSRRFLYNSGCRTYEKNFGATSLSTFTANQSAIPAR